MVLGLHSGGRNRMISVRWRPAWCPEQVLGQPKSHGKTLSQKANKPKTAPPKKPKKQKTTKNPKTKKTTINSQAYFPELPNLQ